MRRALIGEAGAVLSLLRDGGGYSDILTGDEVRLAEGGRYDEAVCVSAPEAGSQGEAAAMRALALCEGLLRLRVKRLTLVSTTSVYPNPSLPLNEDADLSGWPNSAFGRAQLQLERSALAAFPAVFILRAPALYGAGLDRLGLPGMSTQAPPEFSNPASSFQWYPLMRLPRDLVIARHQRFSVVNLVTEPLSNARLMAALFPGVLPGLAAAPAPYFRLRTKHAAAFGGAGGYILRAADIIEDMRLVLRAAAIKARAEALSR